MEENLAARLRPVRLLLSDVDGVLTDGMVAVLPDGNELKSFSIRDGLAIHLARDHGIEVGFLSGRRSSQLAARARELGVQLVVQGCGDKLQAFEEICGKRGLEAEEAAFVGDDLPDIRLLREVGFAAVPCDAAASVRAAAHYVTRARGGKGVLREVVELILEAQGKWQKILKDFGLD